MRKCWLLLLVIFLATGLNTLAQPVIKIRPIDKRCVNGPVINLNDFVTVDGIFKSGGIWSSNSAGIIYADKFNPIAAGVSSFPGWKVIYEYTDPVSHLYAKDSAYVTVYALPKPFAGFDDSICTGAKKTLTGIPLIPPGTWYGTGVGGYNNNWWFNPDTAGIANGGSYYNVYHYTDNNGCENEDTMRITVWKTPVVEAGNSKEFCITDKDVTLTGSPAGGIWTGTGIKGNQFVPSFAQAGNHKLKYTYTNVQCVKYDTAIYSVYNLPLVTANTMSGDTFFCRTEGIIELNGQPYGAGGFWTGPGVTGATFNTSIGGDITTKYTLRYDYTDNHKCRNKDEIDIWVKPEPVVVIDPSSGRYCTGGPITITASYNHANGIFWSKGPQSDGIILGDPTSPSIGYNPGINDINNLSFWLFVKTIHFDSVCAPAYDSIEVHMSATPVANFSASPLTGGVPLTVKFTDSSSVQVGNIQLWEWWFGDGGVSGDTNPVHTYTSSAKFDVKLTVISDAGCENSIIKSNYIANAIDQHNHNSQFKIYPNPAHSALTIENPLPQSATILMSDVLGNTILEKKMIPGKNTFNVENFKPGLYFIFVDSIPSGKLLIE